MQNHTRQQYTAYLARLAQLNGVDISAVTSKFAVDPTVQQTLENRIQESSEFLKRVNIVGVTEQEGEVMGLGVSGPVASTTDTSKTERQTSDVATLDAMRYRCEQTNYDTHITYQRLDMWAKFPDFQTRLRDMIIQRIALDRIMTGFHGVSRSLTSDRAKNPLLEDVNKGWLQNLRDKAPQRWMKEGKTAGKIAVGASGDYKNLDALVMDAVDSLLDPWFQEDTQLVAITGRRLMADKLFPLINTIQPPTEQKAAQDMVTSQKRLGNLQAVQVPYFPDNAILVTRLDNLSLYYQNGAQRRSVIDNPKRDRIETYQSSNDAYVIEDFGCATLIENISLEAAA